MIEDRNNPHRCVVDAKNYYVEFVLTHIDPETGERYVDPKDFTMQKGYQLIEADPPYWTLETEEHERIPTYWTGKEWSVPKPPPPPPPPPVEERKAAYQHLAIIEWYDEKITVDAANLLFTSYYAEWLSEHDTSAPIPDDHILHYLAIAIHEAKDKIREMFPDETKKREEQFIAEMQQKRR